MKVYKGTNKDIQCNGYQFEIGVEHKEKTAKLCNKGFHACENPLDVLKYYPPVQESRYFEAELDATEETHDDDTKRVGKKIKLVAEIGLPGLIKAGLQFVFEKVDKIDFSKAEAANSGHQGTAANSGHQGTAANSGDQGTAANSGYRGTAANSGYQGTAANSGDQGTAANSGDQGTAANSGYQGTAANSGDQGTAANSGYRGTAETTGKDSVAVATGFEGKAKGVKGCVLFLIERDVYGKIVTHKSLRVDGKRYKENVLYILKGGKVVEFDR